MKQFYIRLQNGSNEALATSIQVTLTDGMLLRVPDEKYGGGYRVNHYAVSEALRQTVGGLADYALSEAILSFYEDTA